MDSTSEHILDNGLKVIVVESHGTPAVCCSVWYRAGSKHESAGTTGLAHLLEHMMFKGTERFPKGELDRILHRIGAINNASTWMDRTNYYELISADRLDAVLELEADRMRGALFTQRDIEDEMPVVRNELERDEDDPHSNLFERIQSTAFLEHPYHWPTIGWKSDVEAIRAEQIREFYDRFYHPGNAFLVIAGDVTPEQAVAAARRAFGGIPAGPAARRPVTVEPAQKGERRLTIRKPGENDILAMAFRIPQRLHPDNYALDLLGQVLGQGRTSRLYRALVEKKIATRVSAANNASLEDPYLFVLDADVAPGVDPAAAEEAVQGVLDEVRSGTVLPEEMERAKKKNRVDFIYRKDRVSRQAFFVGELEIACGWRFGSTYLEETEKVTVEDILRVAGTYLVSDARTVGFYLAARDAPAPVTAAPETGRPASGRVAGGEGGRTDAGASAAAARAAVREPARTHRAILDNGIRLLVRPNRANRTVEIVGQIEGGALLEGDRVGLCYGAARMLDRGTLRHPRVRLSEILEGLGASISFRSSTELIGFHAKCLSEDLDTVGGLLSEMLSEPAFPPEEWEIVRQQTLNAIRESRQDTFDRAFYRAMEILCGPGNVYARPITGSEDSVEALAVDDLRRFQAMGLAGRRITAAVVGDVSVEEGVELVSRHLGGLPAGEEYTTAQVARALTPAAVPAGDLTDHVEIPEKSQVDLIGALPGISRDDPSYDAASVANYILGGHFSSRLNKQLRDNEGLTYGVHSRLRAGLGLIPWYVSIGAHPDNLQRAREGILREMKSLCGGGVGEEEFEDAMSHLAGSFPVRLEANGAVASLLLEGERYGLGPEVIETYVDRLRAIRKGQVEEEARRLFRGEGMVLVTAGTLGRR